VSAAITSQRFLAALELPAGARQNVRIAKKILADQAASNPAERKMIEHGLDEVVWVGAFKPATIAVPAFEDENRDWGEIAVITLSVREGIDSTRIATLMHKAIPYPLLLVLNTRGGLQISCAWVRRALNNPIKRVADAPMVVHVGDSPLAEAFISAWALPALPATNMAAIYEAFIARLESWRAAEVTGRWNHCDDSVAVMKRRDALLEYGRLVSEIAAIRKTAGNARSMRDRMALNGEVQAVLLRLEAAKAQL
jgi:hypothetical protein